MLLRIDDTDPARNLPGRRAGDHRRPALARDRLGRRAGAPERAPGALPRGRRGPAGSLPRSDPPARGRHGDLPPRERRRRPRLRDHPRAARQRPPAQRGAPPRALARDRRPAPEYLHYGLVLGPDGKKLSKRAEGALDRLAARRRASRPRRSGPTSRSSASPGTTSASTSRASARSRSTAIAALRRRRAAPTARVPPTVVPALRGARDLGEAASSPADHRPDRPCQPSRGAATLERFAELRAAAPELLDEARARGDRPRAEGGRRPPARRTASR